MKRLPAVDPVTAIATAFMVFFSGKYMTMISKAHTVTIPVPTPPIKPYVTNIGKRLGKNDVTKIPAEASTIPKTDTER